MVKTWGSAPRPIGAMLVIRDDGHVMGSVSGGCVEGAVIEEACAAMNDGKVRKLEFGVSDEQAWSVGLACGGLQLVLEPVKPESQLKELLRYHRAARVVARTLDLESGRVKLEAGRWSDALSSSTGKIP